MYRRLTLRDLPPAAPTPVRGDVKSKVKKSKNTKKKKKVKQALQPRRLGKVPGGGHLWEDLLASSTLLRPVRL